MCFSYVGLLPSYETGLYSNTGVRLKKKNIVVELAKTNSNNKRVIIIIGIEYTTVHQAADSVLQITTLKSKRNFFPRVKDLFYWTATQSH
jgi:hypothetical protein